MDPLLDIFRTMQLRGGIFLEAEFTAPWSIVSQVTPEDCSPFMPRPADLIAYHYVTEGRLVLTAGGRPPREVQAGEIILLPRNARHVIGSSADLKPVSADLLVQVGSDGGLARIVHGGGGERTLILCGFLGTNAARLPICDLLPDVLVIDAEAALRGWIESSFRFGAQQLAAGHTEPGRLAKLAELLFVEAVRGYVATLPADSSRWIAGLRDPVVSRALALLHGDLARRWTTDGLAREVGLSRSAFVERFTALMGEPPIRYLARWRMQVASQRLTGSRDPVARIAFEAGYESEAAFNRAFKRAFGLPPAAWRKGQAGQLVRAAPPAPG